MRWRKKNSYAMLEKIHNTRGDYMKWGMIIGLYVFQSALFSSESNKASEPLKEVQFSQDPQEEEEELVVFEDSDFTEDESSE